MLNSPLLIKGSTRKGEGLEDILLQYQHESINPYTELTLTFGLRPEVNTRDPTHQTCGYESLLVAYYLTPNLSPLEAV